MKKQWSLYLSMLFLPALAQQPSKPFTLVSPNEKIVFSFKISTQAPLYAVSFNQKPLLTWSALGLELKDLGHFSEGLRVKKIAIQTKNEPYELVVGKAKKIQNHYKEARIFLQQTKQDPLNINLIVRVYDDAVAFRYEFPKQRKDSVWVLNNENTTFRFAQNPTVYTLFRENYRTSHEGLYSKTTLASIPADTLMDMPTLLELKNDNKTTYAAITEAALLDYAGMYLSRNKGGELISKLSPLPNQSEQKVRLKLPHKSPWRVIMLSDKIGKLMESNILTNLNDPPRIKDWSWLKTGRTDFPWWNGDVLKEAKAPVGLNYATHKQYIDFCAANHIDFHSVVSYGSFAWYQGEREGFNPASPDADITKPVEALEMEKLAAYSRQKGVGLRVWVNWESLARKIDEAFPLFEKWNIKGLMVDFMDRDDQEMVNFVEEVLQKAAKYHLHIQFHGAYKPTGLSRTYPNELTKEGVLNLENLKWGKECDPEHNLMVPFTRMLAGPMDYHAGGFRSLPREQFKVNFTEPNVLGTRCHHLAMPVVYESYLQMLCDYPEAYQHQEGFELLQQVPSTWDEMRVLNAQIGDYLTIARRKEREWYIGTMNDWTPRELKINLSFLPVGQFTATIYEDAPDAAENPNHVTKRTLVVNKHDTILVKLATGGGHVIWLKPE